MRTKTMAPADEPKINDDYEVAGHLKTMLDAHDIMQDPAKLKKVHALVGRHQKAVKSLSDVKDIYQKKFGKTPKQDREDAAETKAEGGKEEG